jgi:hypothetical protein
MKIELYGPGSAIGLLKGFSPLPHQLELEIIVPHADGALPGFGEFLLVEIGANEALVARVSRYHAAGQLASDRGDAYLSDLAKNEEVIPQRLMRQMLRYSLKAHALGHLSLSGRARFQFAVGERAFATLGAKVRAPSSEALAYLCNVDLEGDSTRARLGHLVFGRRVVEDVPVDFSVSRLKGKRSFVFARAGYGKSNLIKYLIAQLYSRPPDVGLLIFDPEGEYALPTTHGPGLVNVPALRDRISLYTNRKVQPEHAAFKRDELKIDFADFFPSDILAAFVPADKHDTVFANLLRGMEQDAWSKLVELLARAGFAAPDHAMATLLRYKARKDDVSLSAIRNNLVPAIKRLHRTRATLGAKIIGELLEKRIAVIDVSLLGGEDSLALTSMLLRRVFEHNIRRMTEPAGQSVRCLAILEEAQTFLGDRALDDRSIFVRWVKEGRKYGLGCMLVTQQPSSISHQIISQGDNFFALHLLNEADLQTLKRHNAHYNDEILAFIRGEPIAGNCYFWSAPHQPFVVSARVLPFDSLCTPPQPPAHEQVDSEGLSAMIGAIVDEALASDGSVFVFRVNSMHEKIEPGLVAFSDEYLRNAVARRLEVESLFKALPDPAAWLRDRLPREIDGIMSGQKARRGYANLAGTMRPVWVWRQTQARLRKPKALKSSVDVVAKF